MEAGRTFEFDPSASEMIAVGTSGANQRRGSRYPWHDKQHQADGRELRGLRAVTDTGPRDPYLGLRNDRPAALCPDSVPHLLRARAPGSKPGSPPGLAHYLYVPDGSVPGDLHARWGF